MTYDLIIVGAGISGLAAADEARKNGLERVLIVDYEREAGGFARGLFETDGFEAERSLALGAAELPFTFRFRSTAVGLYPGENGRPHQINLQTPFGSEEAEAERVLLCTGSLEKPREAHRIAGSRPAGVMTPLMAVQLLQRGYMPGERALAIGSGRVTNAAVKLLREGGCETELLESGEWEAIEIVGHRRVEGVRVRNKATGSIEFKPCDTFVFSLGRIPCTFYLKGGDIERDAHHAVIVDDRGRTNIPGISAAGSCTTRGDDEHYRSAEQSRSALRSLLGK